MTAFEEKKYNWCEVVFDEWQDESYSYFFDCRTLKIGDLVIVPVGKDNNEKIATVINVGKLNESELPYPAEKTKHVIRKIKAVVVNNIY